MVTKAIYYALYAFSRFGPAVQVGDASFRRWRAVLIFSLVQSWIFVIISVALACFSPVNLFQSPKWVFVTIALSTVTIPWRLVNWRFDRYCALFSGINARRRLRYDIIVALITVVIFMTMVLMLALYRESHGQGPV
jgi:hypothetical protein